MSEEGFTEVALRPVILRKELTFKFILLGDSSECWYGDEKKKENDRNFSSGVGKTSLLRRYANEETPACQYKPTIGVDFRTKQLVIDGEHIRALIWDTAGQERFKTMTKQYYRGSHGVVLVYDVTNSDSFNHVERWIRDFQKFADNSAQKILVGNKCDVSEDAREVSFEQGQLLALELDIPFMETSAKDNVNVTEVFEKIAADLTQRRKRSSHLPSPSLSPRTSVSNGSNAAAPIIKLKRKDKPKLMKKPKCCYE